MRKPLLILCVLCLTGCSHSTGEWLSGLFESAQFSWDHGDPLRSIELADRGKQVALLSTDPQWFWKFSAIQAEVLAVRRDWAKSFAALSGQFPESLRTTPLAVRVQLDRGAAQAWLGHYARAEEYFNDAEKLCTLPENSRFVGDLSLRRAGLAFRRGSVDQSEALARNAVNFAREHRQPALEANAMTFLAAIASTAGRWGEAVSLLQPAIESARRLSIQTLLEKNLGNLGWSYYNLGDLDAALASFEEAERVAGKIGLVDERRRWLTDIGLIYEARNDYQTEFIYHSRALALAREINQPDVIAICLHNLATAAFDRKDFKTALDFNRQEIQIKRAIGDHAGELYGHYLEGHLLQQEGRNEVAAKTFRDVADQSREELSLRWQAQIALAKLHIALNQPVLARNDFKAALQTFEQARAKLTRDEFKITFRAGLNRYYSTYIAFLMAQNEPLEALRVAELSRAQVLSERLGVAEVQSLDLPKLQATARSLNATFLSYWLAPSASYLWVVTPRDFVSLELPPGPEIERLAESYRRSIAQSASQFDTRLYSVLIAPAQPYIPHNSRVIVIPDGGLFQINFETLLVPGQPQPHYWIEDVALSTATSLALLAPRPHAPSRGNILLIGNPVSPRPEFPALPYSGAELHSIAQRFPPSQRTLYEGAAAKPTAYSQSRPGGFSWIHFAAHGVSSKESPLDSAIVLSNEADSFRLYAREIAKLPLTADLVTISACYSSGTRAFSGEGIVGLAWAFLLAGAHNVVASLWEANDFYTAQLMDRLYEHLKAGDDPAAALRQAKLSLLHSEYVCRNPRYWGAFQLYTGY